MRAFIDALGEGVFDPETLHILTGAFDDAWASLKSSGAPWAADDYRETARMTIARYIIEAAKGGERNQRHLSEGALVQLTKTDLKKSPSQTRNN